MDEFLKGILSLILIPIGLTMAGVTIGSGYTEGGIAMLLFVFGVLVLIFLPDTVESAIENIFEDDETYEELDETEEVNPVKKLQQQYVTGEISESEFQRRLDILSESQEVSEEIDDSPTRIGEETEIEFE